MSFAAGAVRAPRGRVGLVDLPYWIFDSFYQGPGREPEETSERKPGRGGLATFEVLQARGGQI